MQKMPLFTEDKVHFLHKNTVHDKNKNTIYDTDKSPANQLNGNQNNSNVIIALKTVCQK